MIFALFLACNASSPAVAIPSGRLDVALEGNWTAANGRPVAFPSLQQGTNLLAHHPVTLPDNWNPATHVTFHADATGWLARITIDNVEVGHDVGGLRPVAIDLTGKLHAGPNDLVLALAPATNENILPNGTVQSLGAFTNEMPPPGTVLAGGHMWLEFTGEKRIESLQARLHGENLIATVRTNHAAGEPVQISVVHDGQEWRAPADAVVTADGTASLSLPVSFPLWTTANPQLNWLVATVGKDRRAIRFGARSLVRTGAKLAINGEDTYLAVLRWPIPDPPTRTSLAAFAVELQRLGANGVEFHAQGFSAEALDTLDELGLYAVLTPVCDGKQHANGPVEPHKAWQSFTSESSARIAEHLENHPSVALWHLEGHVPQRDPHVYDAYIGTEIPFVDLHDSQGLEATSIPAALSGAMPAYWNETPWHDPSAAPDLLSTVLTAHRHVGIGLALPNLTMSSRPSPAYLATIAALEGEIATRLAAANVAPWPGGPRRGPAGLAVSVKRGGAAVPGAVVVMTPNPGVLPPIASAADAGGVAHFSIDYLGPVTVSLLGGVSNATTTLGAGEYRPGVFATNIAHTTLEWP